FAQIQDYTSITSFRKTIVSIGEDVFYSKKAFSVDSSFFNVFDFELILGNKETIFNYPNQTAITESMAKLYFGKIDVIGKQIKIVSQRQNEVKEFTIKGVLKDFPDHSHFKADFLCSMSEPSKGNTLSYTYLLLPQNTDYHQIQDSIQANWDKRYAQQNYNPIADLQPLTDIHLYSHKSRELERNANVRTLILLISGAFIILIIALVNFTNLNYVQYLSEQKNAFIRIVNGASRIALAKEYLKSIFVLIALVISLGLLFVHYLSGILGFEALLLTSSYSIAGVTAVFVFLIIIFASFPFLYRKTYHSQIKIKDKNAYKISLVLQLMLSIVTIILTLFLQKQINYLNLLHPQANNANMIVIPENPGQVVAKYKTLKEQALKHPEIEAVTAVSEEPAGIVTDNFQFAYDSDITNEDKTINVLVVDDNFFSFMDIKPIAGTMDMGVTSSLEWERKALELGWIENDNQEVPLGLKEEVTSFSEKYIINKMALEHLGIENAEQAIGKKFHLVHPMNYLFPKGEIIGVVDDFHYTNMYVKEKPLVMISRKIFSHNFLFKIDSNRKSNAIAALKSEWQKINPDVPFQYEFITDSYRKVYQNEYDQMKVLMLFAMLSILLSAIGIYAMVSFNLKMKTKEIGIRKVNGATVLEIMKMLNKDFVKWVIVAFIIAAPISYIAMQKWLENFAYKTELSWWIFAIAGFMALLITLITVSWQTFKAARRNPVDALRYE
ncbi:MAG: FtsX-like permease family protein, partial [Bacteroidales bacterium]|nr:FtsX-like permease family protein [Bacteroidales bacterium]